MSAITWAASGISSVSHCIKTTACTLMLEISSCSFEDDGKTLPARDAERGEPESLTPFAQLIGEAEDDARTAHADRMPDRDASALHVELVAVELQLSLARDHLSREGLVDLDQVDVRQGETGFLQDPVGCGHRADAHDLRRHPRPRPAD